MKKNITIYDIAKEAGVSPATVSRVLTENARVRPEKKEKVMRVIEKYDFKPNGLAKGLSNTKTNLIGYIMEDLRDPFWCEVYMMAEEYARTQGYHLALYTSMGDYELEDRMLEFLMERRVDGIIQIGGQVNQMLSDLDYVDHINRIANTVPIIINGKLDGSDCYQVSLNEGMAMEQLMEYLVNKGHQHMTLICGKKDKKPSYDKQLKFKQLLNKYGIGSYDTTIIEMDEETFEGAYTTSERLFDGLLLPTGIICSNERVAAGVRRRIQSSQEWKNQEPEMVTFGKTWLRDMVTPDMPTVYFDAKTCAQVLIDQMLKAIHGIDMERQVSIQPQIIK